MFAQAALEGGAAVDECNPEGFSALIYASLMGHEACVGALLTAGALVNPPPPCQVGAWSLPSPSHRIEACTYSWTRHSALRCLLERRLGRCPSRAAPNTGRGRGLAMTVGHIRVPTASVKSLRHANIPRCS